MAKTKTKVSSVIAKYVEEFNAIHGEAKDIRLRNAVHATLREMRTVETKLESLKVTEKILTEKLDELKVRLASME